MFFFHPRPPKRRHQFLKCIGWLLAFSALLGVILTILRRNQKEKEELDWYLLSDDENYLPGDVLRQDITNWSRFVDEDQPISLSFTFSDVEQAKLFMQALAASGCSSLLDEGNGVVEVELAGIFDEKELEEMITDISGAMDAHSANYQGFIVK